MIQEYRAAPLDVEKEIIVSTIAKRAERAAKRAPPPPPPPSPADYGEEAELDDDNIMPPNNFNLNSNPYFAALPHARTYSSFQPQPPTTTSTPALTKSQTTFYLLCDDENKEAWVKAGNIS